MQKDDNRYEVALFLLVAAFSFALFSGVLYLIEHKWHINLLLMAVGFSALALLSFIGEWALSVSRQKRNRHRLPD